MLEAIRDGRVLRLILNRPEKRNALNGALCAALADAVESAGEDVGAILLAGAGKSFCSGMDLDEMLTPAAPGLAGAHERIFTIGRRAAVPIVAAVHGAALAGGTGLVANAHIVVAAEDATFGLTEIRIGLWPFVIYRAVVDAVGHRRAVELSITGRIFGAAEAAAMGLAHFVVPAADVMARASEIAAAAAAASPVAIRAGLRYVRETRDGGYDESGAAARRYREEVFRSPEFAAGIRAFREKRKS
jgi:enoyl-CoA hydratase/carnithine racemase